MDMENGEGARDICLNLSEITKIELGGDRAQSDGDEDSTTPRLFVFDHGVFILGGFNSVSSSSQMLLGMKCRRNVRGGGEREVGKRVK